MRGSFLKHINTLFMISVHTESMRATYTINKHRADERSGTSLSFRHVDKVTNRECEFEPKKTNDIIIIADVSTFMSHHSFQLVNSINKQILMALNTTGVPDCQSNYSYI